MTSTTTGAAPSWPGLLTRVLAREDLTAGDTGWVMDRVMAGEASPAQIAGIAIALRAKGETAAEVSGFADSMLQHAVPVSVPLRAVDIVGTGGDRSNSVNISTMAAVVIAAAGAPVVKHGNRAASSKCGSADLIEALGVPLALGADAIPSCVAGAGIAFCFAPVFHPSFRHAAVPRRELGVPTVFNVLGPLTNPARPAAGAIGCGNPVMAPVMAEVFARRGAEVLLFRGDDGLDELTTTTTSTVWQISGGNVTRSTLDPRELGLALTDEESLRGGDVAVNLGAAQDLFAGKTGPVRDAVVLNAAAALAAHAGLSGDLLADLRVGMERASAAIDAGDCLRTVERWREVATSLA